MRSEPSLHSDEEALVQELYRRARLLDIPIDATRWEHPAQTQDAELTVVSNRKAYIVSLRPTDLQEAADAKPQRDIVNLILSAIRDNGPPLRR